MEISPDFKEWLELLNANKKSVPSLNRRARLDTLYVKNLNYFKSRIVSGYL
jgi:hypothetical protein